MSTTQVNEFGFVVAAIIMAALVTTVFILQVRAVGDDSARDGIAANTASVASVFMSAMMKDALFEGHKSRLAEGLGEVASDDVRRQNVYGVVERLQEVVQSAGGSALRVKVITEDGSIYCDTHASTKGPKMRPFGRLADKSQLEGIIAASDIDTKGSFVENSDGHQTMYARRIPLFPSYILLVTD